MSEIIAATEAVLLADCSDTFVTRRAASITLDYGGIPGDIHFGLTRPAGAREPMYPRGTEIFNRRQITILSAEECEKIAENMGLETILPEWLGANMLVRGVPALTQLTPGSRLLFPSGASLYCEGENMPCTGPGEVIQALHPDLPKLTAKFVKAAYHLRGIVCSVERPGPVHEGDTVRVLVHKLS